MTGSALRVLLALCAGCGWLAAAGVLMADLAPGGQTLPALACLAWLIFTPLYEAEVLRAARRLPGVGRAFTAAHAGRALALVLRAAPLLAVLFLPGRRPEALLFGAAILLQGHLFLRREDDRSAAGCLVTAPVVVVLGLAVAPSLLLLLLLPLSCALALAALLLLHGRAASRRVRRTPAAPEGLDGMRRRLAYAGLGSLLVLPLGALIFLATEWSLNAVTRRAAAAAAEKPAEGARAPSAGSVLGPGSGRGGDDFTAELSLSGGAFPFSDQVVMRVRPEQERESAGLHLRGMVLDHFHQSGVSLRRRAAPPRFTDAGDGTRDGWTHVAPRLARSDTRRYSVELRPLTVESVGWTLLFSPVPLVAARIEPLLFDADRLLVTPRLLSGWFTYEVEVARREIGFAALEPQAAVHPDPQYTQLPEHEAMAAIRERAGELCRNARSDLHRVVRVVSHLRGRFTYELRPTDLEGPAAVAEFLELRRGYCTYFASAAVLMLRSEGLASRLATGFLAKEWSQEEGAWLVREKHSHAWIEVHFEGVGWLPFDPTPVSTASGGLPLELGDEEALGWLDNVRARLAGWVGSRGRDVGLGEVLQALLAGPARVLAAYPWAWLPAVAAVLLLARLLRGRGRPPAGEERGGPPPLPSVFRRLMSVLARRGYQRRPGQTPREFAQEVVHAGGAEFAACPAAIDLYYRSRFGARILDPQETATVEALITSLGGP